MPEGAVPRYTCEHCEEGYEDPNCSNCERCENCCECAWCESCQGQVHQGDYCSDCEQCNSCCECLYCPSCGDRVHDGHNSYDYCGDCEHCYSCCECERCDNCGDSVDECCCEAQGILCYSACPVRRLNYLDRLKPGTHFGLEVEMSHWSLHEQERANASYSLLREWFGGLLEPSDGYQITSSDASITGRNPGECKTIPMTVFQHSLLHYSLLVNDREQSVREFVEASPGKQVQLMISAFANDGPAYRWMRGARAWDNDSCGMHINLEWKVASSTTWAKVIHWLMRADGGLHQQIGGRRPSIYCFTHDDRRRAFPKNYLVNTALADTVTWNRMKQKYASRRIPETGVAHGDFPFADYVVTKRRCAHSAITAKSWGGYELRLFRSSTNPLRILGNCELINVILHHFEQVPWHEVCDVQGNPRVSLTDISRTAHELRHRYPYAAALCRRVNNQLSLAFAS